MSVEMLSGGKHIFSCLVYLFQISEGFRLKKEYAHTIHRSISEIQLENRSIQTLKLMS